MLHFHMCENPRFSALRFFDHVLVKLGHVSTVSVIQHAASSKINSSIFNATVPQVRQKLFAMRQTAAASGKLGLDAKIIVKAILFNL